jgi:hypothetical protein
MKTEIFNFDRFKILLNRQLTLNLKPWLISIGSLGGILIFISWLVMISGNLHSVIDIYTTTGIIAFFITGMVFTSMSFKEMGNYTKSLQYILLPASRFEKFFSAWLFSSVIYVLLSIVSLVFFSILISLIHVVFFNGSFEIFNPFVNGFGELLIGYFVAHSVIFTGSIWFRKGAFFKTLLTGFVLQMISNIWIFSWVKALLNRNSFIKIENSELELFIGQHINEVVIKNYVIGFFCLISCILLYAAWERFKEREV